MPRKKFKDFPGNLIKIKVLEEEIKYFKSLIQETDTGHIYTTIDALETMEKNDITQILVTNSENQYLGVVHLHDLIKEGIF